MNNHLKLSEQPFKSIQGEGRTIGRTSLFVRFWGCNLKCEWCDSDYSWKKGKESIIEYPVSSLLDDMCDPPYINNIVFTGGEPLLHQKDLFDTLNLVGIDDVSVEIETNGIIKIKDYSILDKLVNDKEIDILFNISPKLQFLNKKNIDILKENMAILEKIGIRFILKFVDEEHNRDFLLDLVRTLDIEFYNIYIMPECRTREEHLAKFEDTLDFCMEHGFNFSPRAHILLWDNKKGV